MAPKKSEARVHREQHLYAEIEAEVSLCFDQVLFALTEQVFSHFRCRAAVMVLRAEHNGARHAPLLNRIDR